MEPPQSQSHLIYKILQTLQMNEDDVQSRTLQPACHTSYINIPNLKHLTIVSITNQQLVH